MRKRGVAEVSDAMLNTLYLYSVPEIELKPCNDTIRNNALKLL